MVSECNAGQYSAAAVQRNTDDRFLDSWNFSGIVLKRLKFYQLIIHSVVDNSFSVHFHLKYSVFVQVT